MALHREIAEAIRELRSTLQESRQDFAKRFSVSPRTIARYELEEPPKRSISFKKFVNLAEEVDRKDLKAIFEEADKHYGPTQRTFLAHCIQRFRTALGLTQEEFAAKAGLSAASIAKYEVDAEPNVTALKKLAVLARRSGLEDYAKIFEGDASLLAKFSVRESSILWLLIEHSGKEALRKGENLRLRLTAAVLLCAPNTLEHLWDLLSEDLFKVDRAATRIGGWTDAYNAAQQLEAGGNKARADALLKPIFQPDTAGGSGDSTRKSNQSPDGKE